MPFLLRKRPNHDKTHLVMHRLENFICYHRKNIWNDKLDRPLTFHGLRHTCAADWYERFVAEGKTAAQARREVSKLLGHERDDVTRIYLSSVMKGGKASV